MSTSAQRRLIKDLQRIQKQTNDDIIASPSGENILRWTATIQGIEGTPWEGGLFQLRLEFTENYPNKAPNVKFTSQMFHPNIYNDGRICLDILQNQWSPVYDVWSILTAIRSLLADPNPLSPANTVASKMFKDNKSLYQKKVKEIVQKSLKQQQDEILQAQNKINNNEDDYDASQDDDEQQDENEAQEDQDNGDDIDDDDDDDDDDEDDDQDEEINDDQPDQIIEIENGMNQSEILEMINHAPQVSEDLGQN